MKLLPSHKRLLILVMLLAIAVALASRHGDAYSAPQQSQPTVPAEVAQIPDNQTRAVQLVLKSFGYTIAVDGVYGPQTTKVVMLWQKANGLLVDGVAGPITQQSLGLSSKPATRSTPIPVTPLSSLSVPDMIRAIWPDDLEEKALRIAYRESRYNPGVTSSTGCCHGVFQIHEVHLRWMHLTVDQLFDAETNIRAALALYERDGWAPWNL